MTATPARASAFVDSIGVNVHMGYLNTPYGNVTSVLSKLDYLGLHHVRDAAAWSGWVPPLEKLGKAGIELNLMVGGQGEALATQFGYAEKLAPYIASIEGPNEVNYWNVTHNGVTGASAAVQQQTEISRRMDTSGALQDKPLVGFSVAASSDAGFAPYGNNSAPNDYGNAHVYFNADAPRPYIQKYIAMANKLTPGDTMFLTETGYPTNAGGPGNQGVSETVQAKYTLDLLMDAYQQGVRRTFLYELQDVFKDPTNQNQDSHYGLFRNDGTAKPVATAIRNLTTILADEAPNAESFATGTLGYSVSGLPTTGSSLLLQESNGNFDVVLWNEPKIWDDAKSLDLKVAPTPVTLSLGATYQTVHVYDPLQSSSIIKTYSNVSSITVDLTDHPLIVEVLPSQAPAAQVPSTTPPAVAEAMPSALYSGTSSTWMAAGSEVSVGHITVGGEDYMQASVKSAWNSVKSVQSKPSDWSDSTATHLSYDNFVTVDLDFRAALSRDLDVMAVGAKRGTVQLGNGDDHFTWVAQSNGGVGFDETMVITSGGGDDTILITTTKASALDNHHNAGNGAQWNANYDGTYSVAQVNLGAGSDKVSVEGMVKLKLEGGTGFATVQGGANADLIAAGSGGGSFTGRAGKDVFAFNEGDGHVVLTDFTRGQDRLQFNGILASEVSTELGTEGGVSGLHVTYGDEAGSIFLPGIQSLSAVDMIFG
jgi:hypothetical protein